ncbi:MAG: glycoside hydrolase family 36 protein [Succinivibrio sp.]
MEQNYLFDLFNSGAKQYSYTLIKVSDEEYLIRKTVTDEEFASPLTLFASYAAKSSDEFYAEGYQMLSQCEGTFEFPVNIGRCPDDEPPYSLCQKKPYKEGYNFIVFKHNGLWHLIGFCSCNHSIARFKIYPQGYLEMELDLLGKSYKSGQVIESEYLALICDKSKNKALERFAQLISKHHTKLACNTSIFGWCSWYSFYEDVNENNIYSNLMAMREHENLSYLLIDDGYQTHMGDWLTFSNRFSNGLEKLCEDIIKAKKIPSIWIAPFIASEKSELFIKHQDYFAKDNKGSPVAADEVTYSGWRDLKWYTLDFSKTEVVNYVQEVFRYFHDKLKIRLYKLDACYWGAIRSLKFQSENFNCIDNYRTGLKAILEIIGHDSVIIGCNAPMWPSLGLVHAMRVGDDIIRNGDRILQTSKEIFSRMWMHKKLWLNDPDCLCLKNFKDQTAKDEEFNFHLCTILATTGVLMLGDDLEKLEPCDFEKINLVGRIIMSDPKVSFDEKLTTCTLISDKLSLKVKIFFNYSDQTILCPIETGSVDLFSGRDIDTNKIRLASHSAVAVKESYKSL